MRKQARVTSHLFLTSVGPETEKRNSLFDIFDANFDYMHIMHGIKCNPTDEGTFLVKCCTLIVVPLKTGAHTTVDMQEEALTVVSFKK